MKLTAVHNIAPHPSFAQERERRKRLDRFTGNSFDPDAEFARLTAEVARIKRELAELTPERISEVVNTMLRPLRAEMALVANEQAQRDRAARFDDFSDVDLNALIEENHQ